MFQRLILCLALLGCTLASAAEDATRDATARLEGLLSGIGHLQGAFSQRQYGDDGAELAVSSGRFKLLQPGFFAWDIQSPDSQFIVAGPEFIWHYDRDLETVTRRPVAGQDALSPLQVLGGEEGALAANYTVAFGEAEGQYVLQPTTAGAGFSSLVLTFANGTIERLSFADNLGQRVEIELAELDARTPIEPAEFDFVPPEGADIFYHDQ